MGSYFGTFRQRPGMQKSPDRPEAVTPVPEEYEGTNFPYRGIENHGVAPTVGVNPEDYYDHDQWTAGPEKIDSEPPDPEPDPVKVKIVNETARERFAFRTYQFLAEGERAHQFIGRNDKRSTVRIKVEAAATTGVLVGTDPGIDFITGYLVEAGQELVVRTTEEMYCLATKGSAGAFQAFYVLEEFSVEL